MSKVTTFRMGRINSNQAMIDSDTKAVVDNYIETKGDVMKRWVTIIRIEDESDFEVSQILLLCMLAKIDMVIVSMIGSSWKESAIADVILTGAGYHDISYNSENHSRTNVYVREDDK